MPTVELEFSIEHVSQKQPAFASRVNLADLHDFWRIADLGFRDRMEVGQGNSGGRLKIRVDENDPRLSLILKILSEHGYHPSKRASTTVSEREHSFSIQKYRNYSEAEICAAPLLMLRPRFCKDVMANYFGGDDDHGWIAKADKRLEKKKLEIGHFDSFEAILLGQRLHDLLEQSRLAGLDFMPVRYDHPEKAARQLWQFGHKIVMPPCLLPRQGVDRLDYVEGEPNGAYWDDAGYVPPELRFRRDAVEAMGDFDVARTREKVGFHAGHYRSEVIVSQRFREVLEKAKITTIDYVPVRLVD